MKSYEFKKIGTAVVGSSRVVVKEYVHGGYFQIGTHRIPAKSKDEAIQKCRDHAAKERNEKQ
jgi:hypothetical protein